MRKNLVGGARQPLVFACACALVCVAASCASAQSSPQSKPSASSQPPGAPLLTRTTTRHEVRRFAYGGTLTISGAPVGSITVEAWPRAELDVTADIELQANTEEDLARLAAVNNFLLDADGSHFRVITTGTHDRKFMKRAKDFPKPLLAMPWRIDYHVRVPAMVDLEITSGRGALTVEGVEGALQLTAGESNASLTLAGGDVVATILSGSVLFRVPAPSWRGRGAQLRLVRGTLTVALPANFNADVDATVLRAGEIAGAHDAFAPREGEPPQT
ncbi:MAG: hypothetical protein LC746_13085, partial [Acidobacteria bacterium]|nr:hypothetical protein [Acidobacteriota bacterium]